MGLIDSKFEGKEFLIDLTTWAKTVLTKEGVMELSAIIEKHLVFSGILGVVAEQFDGTLLDQLFEKGYDAVFPEVTPT